MIAPSLTMTKVYHNDYYFKFLLYKFSLSLLPPPLIGKLGLKKTQTGGTSKVIECPKEVGTSSSDVDYLKL